MDNKSLEVKNSSNLVMADPKALPACSCSFSGSTKVESIRNTRSQR